MAAAPLADLHFAVIGGTGLYAIDELTDVQQHEPQSAFGALSGPVTVGTWHGRRVAFLARHGAGHTIAPHRVNYRANIDGLRLLGVRGIVAINAVGGIGADFGPRCLSVPDQLIDYTHGRLSSFSDRPGVAVEHIDFSDPYSAGLRQRLLLAADQASVPVVRRGTYAVTEGPRLETRAEISRLARDGADLVGMTAMPEAALAREAGLDYASLCVVANWAAGCGDTDVITMDEIHAHLKAGMQSVRQVLAAFLNAAG
jgi:5'-methylthioinosine phosphorylase